MLSNDIRDLNDYRLRRDMPWTKLSAQMHAVGFRVHHRTLALLHSKNRAGVPLKTSDRTEWKIAQFLKHLRDEARAAKAKGLTVSKRGRAVA